MILYCPADLPLVTNKDMLIKAFEKSPKSRSFEFEYVQLTEKSINYETSQWTPLAREEFLPLVDWIDTHLPYKKLVNVKLVRPIMDVATHIDFSSPEKNMALFEHNNACEPCGYRIVLQQTNNNSLFIEANNKIHITELPKTTDTYIIGHTNTKHGLTNCSLNTKRISVFIHCWLNTEPHKLLLSRSANIYNEYIIRENEFRI